MGGLRAWITRINNISETPRSHCSASPPLPFRVCVVVAILCCTLSSPDLALAETAPALAASASQMTANVKLVDDYETWYAQHSFDLEDHKGELLSYITEETILHEPASLPWGGTMVGAAGWAVLERKSRSALSDIANLFEVSPRKYYQDGDTVLCESYLIIKATKAAPTPFRIGLIEKFKVSNGRIVQIDEFWQDTAGLLARLQALGAWPKRAG